MIDIVEILLLLIVDPAHGELPTAAALIISQASSVHAYTGVATIWPTIPVPPIPPIVGD